MFSTRTPARHAPNRLTRATSARRGELIDLTVSNPTVVGLPLGDGPVLPGSEGRRDALYAPEPRGQPAAREAVAAYYAGHAVEASPDRIVLTASSSEAYSWLFKLLCDPGEAILVPAPSYPLLDALAGLESVVLVPYRLPPEDGWSVHASAIEEAALRLRGEGGRARAIILVNPNNPTGTSVSRPEFERLVAFARREGLAVISDEVFLDYRFEDRPSDVRVAATGHDALVFSLGGLSKAAALPQLKLGWILASGPSSLLEPALERLDWIADSFLSVGTPVQLALPALLGRRHVVAGAIRERIAANDRALRALFPRGGAVDVLPLRGGWSAVLRVPAILPEEELAVRLVERYGLLVQPGFFFDFPAEAFLVVSLLPDPGLFAAGIARLRHALDEAAA